MQVEFLINSVGHPCCTNGCPHVDVNVNLIQDGNWISAHGSSIKDEDDDQHEELAIDEETPTYMKPIHGILGQTVTKHFYPEKEGEDKHLEGTLQDYEIKSNSLFGDDFTYNLFAH